MIFTMLKLSYQSLVTAMVLITSIGTDQLSSRSRRFGRNIYDGHQTQDPCSFDTNPELSVGQFNGQQQLTSDFFRIVVHPGLSTLCQDYQISYTLNRVHFSSCDQKWDCSFTNLTANEDYNVYVSISHKLRDGRTDHIDSNFKFKTLDLTNVNFKDINLSTHKLECWNKEKKIISWTPQDKNYRGIYKYQIDRKYIACNEKNSNYRKLASSSTHDNYINFTKKNLPYSSVKMQVWASNGGSVNGVRATCFFKNQNPGVPQNEIKAMSCTERSCTVLFERQCQKLRGPNIRMIFFMKQVEGSWNTPEDYRLVDNYRAVVKLPKLVPYTEYEFAAWPANTKGVANRELMTATRFWTRSTKPRRVRELSSESSSTTITLKFKLPSNDPPTGKLEHVAISIDSYNDGSTHNKKIDPSKCYKDLCAVIFNGLDKGDWYTFRVRAKNYNVTALGPVEELRHIRVEVKRPAQPTDLNVSEATETSITISFHREKDNIEIRYYLINITGKEYAEFNNYTVLDANPIKIVNLKSDMKYDIRLQACSEYKCSHWSSGLTAWTRPLAPLQPATVLQDDDNTNQENISVTVSHVVVPADGHLCLLAYTESQEPDLKEVSSSLKCSDEVPNECDYTSYKDIWICKVEEHQQKFSFRPPISAAGFRFASLITVTSGPYHENNISEPSRVFWHNRKSNVGLVITVIISLILVCALIAFILYRRRGTFTKGSKLIDTNNITLLGRKASRAEPIHSQKNTTSSPHPIGNSSDNVKAFQPPSKKVALQDVEEYLVRTIHSAGLEEEFKSIPLSLPGFSLLQGSCDANKKKNRYRNNLPYDETRVILPLNANDPYSDYINANYIDTLLRDKAFIATQGPKHTNVDTREDFYRMIWTTNTSHIVMVANLVEENKDKVAQYWPDNEPVNFGEFQVSYNATMSSIVKLDYKIRTLNILFQGKYKQVKQYQFTGWPDHGKPVCCFALSQMILDLVNDIKFDQPVVVHCSAGIGRTGTILIILEALEQLTNFNYLDMPQALYYLRKGRARLVEMEQYKFAHELLLEVWTTSTKGVSMENFIGRQMAHDTHTINGEYAKLKSLPIRHEYSFASQHEYLKVHRNPNILPPNQKLVFLQSSSASSIDQYIPAVRIKGLLHDDAYLIMEHPVPCNVNKAWQLVYEKKAPLWIILNSFPAEDTKFPDVLAQSRFPQKQSHKAAVTSFQNYNVFVDYSVEVSPNTESSDQPRKCRVVHFLDWPYGNSIPFDVKNLYSVWQFAEAERENGPVLISCGDGVSSCGLFLAFCLTVHRLQINKHVDIYSSVMSALFNRTKFIVSQDQYQFLYKAVDRFLQECLSSIPFAPEFQIG